MKSTYLVEDTSFVASLMNDADANHAVAREIFSSLLLCKNKIRVVLPSIVIFETLFVLMRNRMPKDVIQNKLWRLLMIFDVLNFPIIETTALRVGSKMEKYIRAIPEDAKMQANDLMIIATSLEFEDAPILTFDKKMKTQFHNLHPGIYYALDQQDKTALLHCLQG